jgi:hypothetical protein
VKNRTLVALVAAAAAVAIGIGITHRGAPSTPFDRATPGTPVDRATDTRPDSATTGTPLDRARTTCIAASDPIPNWSRPPPANCAVAWDVLGDADGRTLYAGRYSWPSDAGEPAAQQKYKVVTVVLYEGRKNDASIAPIWHSQLDETDEAFRSVSLQHAGTVPIVKVETCLNGTGGCATVLYRWRPGALVDISADLRAQVARALPPGYEMYKAPEIDLQSMKVSGGAWGKGDPNCCPSSTVTCALHIDDEKATVSDCRVTPQQAK